MGPLVYLEILRPSKHFPAPRKRTRKRLLSSVHSYMVHQLIFRFERPAVSRAALPKTGVRRALGPADVFHGKMRHDLVHAGEQFVAQLARRRLLRVEPLAAHVAPRRRAHVAQEGVRGVRVSVRHQRRRAALVVHVTAPVPALLQRLLREQLAAGAVLAQVAGLVRVQWVRLVVRRVVRWRVRRSRAVLRAHAACRLRGHLQPVGCQVRVVRFEEGVHGGGGRRRRIAPFTRHHPRGGVAPLTLPPLATSPTTL